MHGLLACSWRGHAIPHHMDDEISVSIDLFVDAMENKVEPSVDLRGGPDCPRREQRCRKSWT